MYIHKDYIIELFPFTIYSKIKFFVKETFENIFFNFKREIIGEFLITEISLKRSN